MNISRYPEYSHGILIQDIERLSLTSRNVARSIKLFTSTLALKGILRALSEDRPFLPALALSKSGRQTNILFCVLGARARLSTVCASVKKRGQFASTFIKRIPLKYQDLVDKYVRSTIVLRDQLKFDIRNPFLPFQSDELWIVRRFSHQSNKCKPTYHTLYSNALHFLTTVPVI